MRMTSCFECPFSPIGVRMVLGVAVCFALVGEASAEQPGGSVRLRVMTYNIHHGEGTDGAVDLARIAQVIREVRPDLVALQEVDQRTRRTGGVDQTAELARLTGMHGLFGPQIPFEGGKYGQAILSRTPASDLTVHWLPKEPDRERRIAVSCQIELDDQRITFVTTHLHHQNASFRERQAEAINKLFANSPQPVILAGDLNVRPESSVMKILAPHWQNGTDGVADRWTFPATKPEAQIDFVLARPVDRWSVRETSVPPEPLASDHCPLVVDYELKVVPEK